MRSSLPVTQALAATKLASGNQLRRVAGGGDSTAAKRAARRELARLTEWRVLTRLDRRQGGLGRGSDSFTYGLGLTGQRLTRSDVRARQPYLPRPAMWVHVLLGAEVYARTVEHARATGRNLRLWQGEPAAWRQYPGAIGERLRLKPDAHVVIDGAGYEDSSFVECDTGSQSPRVIRAKLDAYERYAQSGSEQQETGVFPRVVFVTTTEERHAVLVDLIGERDPSAWRLFFVCLTGDAGPALCGDAS